MAPELELARREMKRGSEASRDIMTEAKRPKRRSIEEA